MFSYDKKYKQEIVMKYVNGESVESISKKEGLTKSTIYRWIDETPYIPIAGFQKTIKEQEAQIKRLKTMIEIIHNWEVFKEIPLYEKLEEIDEIYQQYGINVSCDALGVARGTFHNHQKHGKERNWLHIKRKNELLPEIMKIDAEFNHIYGANKITAELSKRGFVTCKRTVSKIMKEENIISVRNYSTYYKNSNKKDRKENLLKRNFKTEKPNQVWASDVTYLTIDDKNKSTYFLCVIIDLFSRKVVAYSIGNNNSKQLINTTLKKALLCRKNTDGLVFHSDRGGNYVSNSFKELLIENNIEQSFSRSGNPYDNSVAESFFQIFKKESFYRYHIQSKTQLVNIIDEFIAFYNEKRLHSYLNFKSPDEFEKEYFEKQ